MAQVRAHNEGLSFGVTDTANAHGTAHLVQITFKLGTKLGVFNVVDSAYKAFFAQHHHAAPAGSQVRVIIGSIK
jgi:hypothetical protein